MGPNNHPRPEDVALAGWPSAAEPRVASVDVRGEKAEVHILVGPSYDYWVKCVRQGGRWVALGDGNAPSSLFFDTD